MQSLMSYMLIIYLLINISSNDQLKEKINHIKNLHTISTIPNPERFEEKHVVSITAYTNSVKETDNTPNITASGKKVKKGYIAVSRDLLSKWGGREAFGSKVYILDMGIFEIQDVMNKKWKKKIDIFMYDVNKAKKFGIKKNITIIKLKGD
jgi:3D (Asp-Asp-Asp) domain-containing protein